MSIDIDKAQKFEEKSVKKEKTDPYEFDDSKIEESYVFPDSTTTTASLEITDPLIDSEQQSQKQPKNPTQSSSGQSEQGNTTKTVNKSDNVSPRNYFGISVVVVLVAIIIGIQKAFYFQ